MIEPSPAGEPSDGLPAELLRAQEPVPLPPLPSSTPAPPAPAPPPVALSRGALGAWWAQGARAAFLFKPRWDGLPLTPAIVAWLFLVPAAFALLVERLYIAGAATFYWPSLVSNDWMTLVVWLVASWTVARGNALGASTTRETFTIFAMLCAQTLTSGLLLALIFLPLVRGGSTWEGPALTLQRAVWLLGIAWYYGAQALLLWRSPGARWQRRAIAVLGIVACGLVNQWFAPVRHWYPLRTDSDSAAAPAFRLTQEVFEAQAAALQRDLAALAPQRRGVVDVYAITFAPDADEDVFERESTMVAGVMQQRFDARVVQLVSRRDAAPRRAWATPINLQRAIERAGQLMNRAEDVLFIHLVSHGARNGTLAASFWPLDVDAVTPQALKTWLDAAGIRYRVISVSACYSGSWIAPLAGDGTLVMTAADSEHTSYGCGSKSELTFFGRAMYDENLRSTWSFEAAHAKARVTIEAREHEAGKTDGYSNPQIAVGEAIRRQLKVLEDQQAASAARR